MLSNKRKKLICALDVSNTQCALQLVENLDSFVGMFKIGLEYYTATGMAGLSAVGNLGVDVFLDLKFHDIPNTVSKAISNFVAFDFIKMATVHFDGKELVQQAVKAANGAFDIIVVTELTSTDSRGRIGRVIDKTRDALDAGAQGIVCSPKEAKLIRTMFGEGFKIITPGIRLTEFVDDHKHTGSPKQAILDGADYIVVGRPIIEASDPVQMAKLFLEQI